MTEREQKQFDTLRKQGWFDGEPEPRLLAFYDLAPVDSEDGQTVSESGLRLCRGAALIYADKAVLWQDKARKEEILLPPDASLTAEITEGSVAMILGDRILFRGRMKQKTKYYLLAKRYADIKAGKADSRDDEKAAVCIKCGRPLNGAEGEICGYCKSKKRVVRQLWEIMTGSKRYLFTAIVLFFVVTGINLLSPRLNKLMVDEYISPRVTVYEGFAGWAIPFFVVILTILAVNLLSRALSILRSRILINASNGVIIRLRETVFEKIEKLSVANVARRTAGNLMHRVTNDTTVIQNFLTNNFANLVEQILMFAGIGTVLFVYSWQLALIILAPVPLAIWLNLKFRRRTQAMYHTQWEKSSRVETFLHDIFSGIRVVKAFGTEERERTRFEKFTAAERDIQVRNERFYAIFSPILTFLLGIGEIFLVYYTGVQNLGGSMTLGDISMFTAYVSLIYGPLQFFANLLRQFANMVNSASKVFEILDEKVDVADSEAPVERAIEGTIELKDVSFDYDERNEVLKHISLTVHPGEMIGIVGKSGVGKSTLINLVMRMYDVDEGEILIDGINIKDYSQECLRSQIGAVLQETFLFSGTIYDNIAYAKPTAGREEVIAAAKLAGAHTFIMKLPDAYDTKVGERGYTLSGGERQRVTIARALLHDPRILILDEATSALDTETEKQIQDALQVLIQNRTTLAIAHRLSTLRNATRLIVLSEGGIAEEGTHEELMAKKGMYYDLVMAQRQMFSNKFAKELPAG